MHPQENWALLASLRQLRPLPPEHATIISDDGIVVYDPNPESTETSDYLFFEALAALLSMY